MAKQNEAWLTVWIDGKPYDEAVKPLDQKNRVVVRMGHGVLKLLRERESSKRAVGVSGNIS